MEAHFRTEDTAESRSILEGQLRESYGRVVYSHKTHEKRADMLLTKWGRIKFLQIALSAMTTAGFVGTVFGVGPLATILGLIFSMVLVGLNAYTKDYDLGELAQKHRQTASDLWLVRESYLSLLVDLAMKERPLEALQEERDKLVKQLHGIYSSAPSTTSGAYKEAQHSLKELEDMTFSDAEIDAFLPKELKRTHAA